MIITLVIYLYLTVGGLIGRWVYFESWEAETFDDGLEILLLFVFWPLFPILASLAAAFRGLKK